MTEPRVLGSVASYADLHELMRARADELEISRQAIDQLARLQPGYAGKLLSPRPMRRLTDETLGFVLPALGMRLVLVEDLESLEQIKARASKRNNGCTSHASTVRYTISRRELRRRQRKGGKNSRAYLSKSKVRQLARKAGIAGNLVRWRDVKAAAKPKITEITNGQRAK